MSIIKARSKTAPRLTSQYRAVNKTARLQYATEPSFALSKETPAVPLGASVTPAHSMGGPLAKAVSRLGPVSLEELDAVALLTRLDSKYVLSQAQSADLVSRLTHDYRVLEIDGRRCHGYSTLYFDTDGLALYRAHHDGRAGRFKVRSRQYLESGLSYFELKAKDRRGRTVKHRMATDGLVRCLGAHEREFVDAHAPSAVRALEPVLQSTFVRITLANHVAGERVTMDIALAFSAAEGVSVLPGVVIVEVKMGGSRVHSPVIQALRAMNIRPAAFSKYCIGVALLRADHRHNRFRPQLRRLERIIGGES